MNGLGKKLENDQKKGKIVKRAGRLSENSRNSFVDLQSKKTVKKDRTKKSSFH